MERPLSTHDVWSASAHLLFELAPRLTRLQNALLKEIAEPLTIRQYRLLLRVHQGASTLTELRTPSTLSLAAVSESVDGLVQRGLLARAVDAADRRAISISITDPGRGAVREAAAMLDVLAIELVGGLAVADPDRVHAVLGELGTRVTERLLRPAQAVPDRSPGTVFPLPKAYPRP